MLPAGLVTEDQRQAWEKRRAFPSACSSCQHSPHKSSSLWKQQFVPIPRGPASRIFTHLQELLEGSPPPKSVSQLPEGTQQVCRVQPPTCPLVPAPIARAVPAVPLSLLRSHRLLRPWESSALCSPDLILTRATSTPEPQLLLSRIISHCPNQCWFILWGHRGT